MIHVEQSNIHLAGLSTVFTNRTEFSGFFVHHVCFLLRIITLFVIDGKLLTCSQIKETTAGDVTSCSSIFQLNRKRRRLLHIVQARARTYESYIVAVVGTQKHYL